MVTNKKRVVFVLDQQVGLRTHSLNLMHGLSTHDGIEAILIPVNYNFPGHWITKIPGISNHVAGTLLARKEILDGFDQLQDIDAVVWGTWAMKFVPQLIEKFPSFFVMDITPNQMESYKDVYDLGTSRFRLLTTAKDYHIRRTYRHSFCFFPWSHYCADSLIRDWNVPPSMVEVVSPGVDVTRFIPGEPNTGGPVRILFVGGNLERKGGDILVEWARKMGSKVQVTLVTKEQVCSVPTNVTVLHGVEPNSAALIQHYQAADIFALPTRADCYSMVAMEAMACGIPVVISDVGGIKDIVDDGITGFLTPHHDDCVFFERLEHLVENQPLRRQMAAAARERAVTFFDATRCAKVLGNHVLAALASACELRKAKLTRVSG